MLLDLDPVPALLKRIRAELAEAFRADRSIRVSRAPGRLDVMGGIAESTGSLVYQMPIDRAAAVASQERDDRALQVFSFNLLDEHKPFTLRIPLEGLAKNSVETLRKEFAEPGRAWAGEVVGCLYVLHERGLIDLLNPKVRGLNLALLSTVPSGAGVGESTAIEVATMMNLADHFGVRDRINPLALAGMCQSVESRLLGRSRGVADYLTSILGKADSLVRVLCQPAELQPALALPSGMRLLGIDSGVRRDEKSLQFPQTRGAAFMGHRMILEKMRDLGRAAHRPLERDPMNGFLANLAPEDYKKFFRPYLPESIKGGEFLLRFGGAVSAPRICPDVYYSVRAAVDHHVLEAMRVRNFARFLEQAAKLPPDSRERGLLLDKAGHLMYASHLSYTNDALLGNSDCDLLVRMVREREREGLYGARITDQGGGGTVAVLMEDSRAALMAIDDLMDCYERQTGQKPAMFQGGSFGTWEP